jgi:glycerophosphoryl diester phosphodiesterase
MRCIVEAVLCMVVLSAPGYRAPVEIIGHRGASHDAPENTMAAVKLAWERQTNAEVDVYLSKDNRMVVIHDTSTKRTGGVNWKVRGTYADRLRSLDVGVFKGREFAGERIPFLAEIVNSIPPGRKLYIEIKCGKEIVPQLQQLLASSDKRSQVVIIGFDLATLAESKRLIDVPTYWLKASDKQLKIGPRIPHNPKLIQMVKDKGLDGLDVDAAGVTPEFVRAVKASGLKLFVWTVDDPAQARRLVSLGVDGITTNRPGWLCEQLGN